MPTDGGSSCLPGQNHLEDTVQNTFVGRVMRREQTQRVFSDIHFTCNSTITQWIIGGRVRMKNTRFLELQLWKRTDSDIYTRRNFNTINVFNTTENTNVYAYFPDPPLEVCEGDILGVFQPRENDSPLTMYYQETSGPFNYGDTKEVDEPYTLFTFDSALDVNDYPLVSVILGEFNFKKLLCLLILSMTFARELAM